MYHATSTKPTSYRSNCLFYSIEARLPKINQEQSSHSDRPPHRDKLQSDRPSKNPSDRKIAIPTSENIRRLRACISHTASGLAFRKLAMVSRLIFLKYHVSPLNGTFSLY